MAHPPKNLQGILWSVDVDRLDIEKNKGYIIHQVLLYGTLEEIRWLFQTYTKKVIQDIFVNQPAKMYPKEYYQFIKNNILSLTNLKLDEHQYITSISGPVRQRTA